MADGHQQVVTTLVEIGFIGQSARCDDANDLAFDRAFGGRRITDLFGNGDGLPVLDQPGNVVVG